MAKFKPGQSGNPKGRPKGIQDRRIALRKVLEEKGDVMIKLAIEDASNGNTDMLKFLLGRLLPPAKALPEQFALEGQSASEWAMSILQEIAQAKLDPQTGTHILKALGDVSRIRETDEMVRRISALEDKLGVAT